MLVIVGMSTYTVHNTEFRQRNGKMLARNGETIVTAAEEHDIPTLAALLQLSDEQMRRVEDVAVVVALPSGDIMQVMMHLDRVLRYGRSGATKLCSADHACIIAQPPNDGSESPVANYTDLDDCSPAVASGGCRVILSEADAALLTSASSQERGRLLAGRRLHWWGWFHSHASGSDPSPSPPPPPSPPDGSCEPHNDGPSYLCTVGLMKGCDCRFADDDTWLGCSSEHYYCSEWNPLCWSICGDHNGVRYAGSCGVEFDCSSATPTG